MSTHTDLLIAEEQIRRFHEDGYLVVENALPPEQVAALLEVIEHLRQRLEHSPHRRQIFGLDVRPLVTEDDAFLELMEWPATFPLVVRLLQHYNIQLTTSHLIVVPPRPDERNIGWHRDGGQPGIFVDGIPPLLSLKVGYFLTDLLEPQMGALMVVPGSHRKPKHALFRPGQQDPDGAVEVQVRAGSAVFFQQGILHAGGPNLSTQTRVVLYYGYGYRVMRPIDYTEMPPELLGRCSPIGQQLLGAKATHLGYHIPTDADCPLKQWYLEHFGETWLAS